MYSISGDNYRYTATCIKKELNEPPLFVDAIIDTGAIMTCFPASVIMPGVCKNNINTSRSIDIGGFVDDKNKVRFYAVKVMQFVIGNIDLGAQTIWITFSDKVADSVIGMDILQKLSFMQDSKRRLHICKNDSEIVDSLLPPIKRKCITKNNQGFIQIYNMDCKFDLSIIKQDKMGQYISVGNQKCYLY